ncbi:hypothetical protein [Haloglomus irregulare]|uniref:hypothetical protein n=1 Tax=Haloglomus irregulare TaxID=2234134 RepID=UPI00192DB198
MRRTARPGPGRLDRPGHDVHVRQGDGREGWPDHALCDAASLTCAADAVPEPRRRAGPSRWPAARAGA